MKLGLFRKSPYEGLFIALSNGAGGVTRRRSASMTEQNKLARKNEAGSDDGSNWSLLEQSDSSNHTTSDAASGSSSVDQGSSSNVGADASSSSQSESSSNTATSPASQISGVKDPDHPVPIAQSAPANSVSQGLPASSSAQSQPGPTLAGEQPVLVSKYIRIRRSSLTNPRFLHPFVVPLVIFPLHRLQPLRLLPKRTLPLPSQIRPLRQPRLYPLARVNHLSRWTFPLPVQP